MTEPRMSTTEMIRWTHDHPAKDLAEELINLEIAGYYDHEPDGARYHAAAREKWLGEPNRLGLEFDAEEGWGPPKLKLVTDDTPTTDFATRTSQQVRAARDLIHEDFDECVRLPWDSLTKVLGHGFLPYQLWTAAAESGHGKTTFAMNVVKALADKGRRVYVVGLEQAAEVLRVYLAALTLGLSTRYALANRWKDLPATAQGAIERELIRQDEQDSEVLHFSDTEYLTVKQLPRVLAEAKDFGAELVLVDHVHHIRGEGRNPYADFERICQTLHGFAKAERIPVLAMAQMNRGQGPQDRLKPYYPPSVNSIQGGKVLEQVSHVVLGLFRPLKADVTKADKELIRLGSPIRDFLKPNTMAVNVLKSRIDGEQTGEIVDLVYDRGHIRDEEPS